MDSSITVYNSYKKGIKSVSGRFPIFNNNALMACDLPSTIIQTRTERIADLYESYDNFYLMREEGDQFNVDANLIDLPVQFTSPLNGSQINTTYNLIIGNELDLRYFIDSTNVTKRQLTAQLSQQAPPQFIEGIGNPVLNITSLTRPPVPCIGVLPCGGATVTIGYDAGSYGDIAATMTNIYVSTDGSLGTLIATVFGNKGTYTINNLLGNTTYYVTAINSNKQVSATLQFTTLAYLYLGYTPN